MKDKTSYGQAVKSIGLIGGSQVFSILIGVVRTKLVAVFIGPIGIGILSVYQATLDIVSKLSGLGISFSAIQEVARSKASEDQNEYYKTIAAIKYWSISTGILGTLLAIVFSRFLSSYSFSDTEHAAGIVIISFSILLSTVAGGFNAVIQGARQVAFVAKISVANSFISVLIAAPLYYFYRLDGIVPYFLLYGFSTLSITYYYYHKLKIRNVKIKVREILTRGVPMIKLGITTVISGFALAVFSVWIRSFLIERLNIEAVGIFQASWSITYMYAGVILGSLVADYYPRLNEVHDDKVKINNLVNEQTEILLLLAAPLILLMIAFSKIVITLFYSSEFYLATIILQWQLVGVLFRILSSPLNYVLMVKRKFGLLLFADISFFLVYVAAMYAGFDKYGLEMTGIAFLIQYIYHFTLLYFINRNLIEYRFPKKLSIDVLIFVLAIGSSLIFAKMLQGNLALLINLLLTCFVVIYSYQRFKKVLKVDNLLSLIVSTIKSKLWKK